jgi:hypothetical protein
MNCSDFAVGAGWSLHRCLLCLAGNHSTALSHDLSLTGLASDGERLFLCPKNSAESKASIAGSLPEIRLSGSSAFLDSLKATDGFECVLRTVPTCQFSELLTHLSFIGNFWVTELTQFESVTLDRALSFKRFLQRFSSSAGL